MIAEECRSLRDQLQEVARAGEREKTWNGLQDRQDDLQTLRDEVLAATKSMAALQRRTPLIGNVDGSKALSRVSALRAALATDPDSITKGKDFAYLKAAFKKFAEQAEAAVKESWVPYRNKVQPIVDQAQLTQARTQADFRATVSQLEANVRNAELLGRNPPRDEVEFQRIEELWSLIRKQINDLPVASPFPEVQKFLRAANSGDGAPLELLTDRVQEWLTSNHAQAKYRVFHHG
jgi:hypothetical protein